MKQTIFAAATAICVFFAGASIPVLAANPPAPKEIDIGLGNISVSGSAVSYYKDSGGTAVLVTDTVFPPGGYRITGTQKQGTILKVESANTPVALKPAIATAFHVTGTLSANQPLAIEGAVAVAGDLNANAALTATGALTVSGNLSAKQTVSASGNITVGKSATFASSLTVGAPPAVGTPPVTPPPQQITVVENMTLTGGNFSQPSTTQLKVGGTLQTTAGDMALSGTVEAGQISCAGKLTAGASTKAGAITAGNGITTTATAPLTVSGTIQTTGGSIQLGAAGSFGKIQSAAAVIFSGSVTAGEIDAVGNVTASAPLTITGDLRSRQGNLSLGSTARVSGTIEAVQGILAASAGVSADNIKTPNGSILIGGDTVVANRIEAKQGIALQGAAQAQTIFSAQGGVTLSANTTATGEVSGQQVTVLNGAWLDTPALTVPNPSASNRFPVDLQLPFSPGTQITLKATGVADRMMTVSAMQSRAAGLRVWLPSGGTVVSAQSGSTSYTASLYVPATGQPVSTTLQVQNVNSGGSGGSRSDSFDEEAYWKNIVNKMNAAKAGDRVSASIPSETGYIPVWVLRKLDGQNIILRVGKSNSYVDLNGKKLPEIPKNKIYYRFDDLKEWYEAGQKAEKPESSSSEVPIVPSVPLPPASSSQPVAAAPSSSSQAVSSSQTQSSSSQPQEPSSSEEESSDVAADEEPEEQPPAKPEKPKRSVVPLVVAGGVIALVSACSIGAYLLYKRRAEHYFDGNGDN